MHLAEVTSARAMGEVGRDECAGMHGVGDLMGSHAPLP